MQMALFHAFIMAELYSLVLEGASQVRAENVEMETPFLWLVCRSWVHYRCRSHHPRSAEADEERE